MAVAKRRAARGPGWAPSPARGGSANGTRPPFTAVDGNNPGWLASLHHGARSPNVLAPLADQIEAEVRQDAPWVNRAAFAGSVRSYAYAEAELTLRRAWIDQHGLVDEEGNPRPGTERLERAEARAAKLRDQLGLNPLGYARLIATVAGAIGPIQEDALEALRAEGRAILAARDSTLETTKEERSGRQSASQARG